MAENITEEKTAPTDSGKKPNAVLAYLKALPKRFFITAFSGMAQGLRREYLADDCEYRKDADGGGNRRGDCPCAW